MLAKVLSGAVVGLDAVLVDVEVDLAKKGLPSFKIVGLPDKAVEEAKERVQSAILNSKADFPDYRLTVNLAPADLKKEGPAYDLPIALGILLASGQLKMVPEIEDSLVLGELSLDGVLRYTLGVLPLTLLAKKEGLKRVFVPAVNAKEAAIIEGIEVLPVESVSQLFYHFSGLNPIQPLASSGIIFSAAKTKDDFADIRGQEHAKRGLEIAAAGGHNVLMKGPPGAGKTMLARALPSILPELTTNEALEITKIFSITGNLNPQEPLLVVRPFRSPHHTTSRIGLIGGGTKIQPGEISLAHRGILFLDEINEFPRHVLESLRQPMEDNVVTISRASGSLKFPANFMLVAASNPCQCGFLGSEVKSCTCSPAQIRWYHKRVSGPILDRIDIFVDVPAVEPEKLMIRKDSEADKDSESETSEEIQARVQEARNRQLKRLRDLGFTSNSEMSTKEIKKFCQLEEEPETLLKQAISQMGLSARAYHKVLKISRTIADLGGSEKITRFHVSEALQYRKKD